MSGGVGAPPCDITLPKADSPTAARRSFFHFRQLNALAVVVVLSASGMVSADDFAFVICSILYIYFISKVAFPPTSGQRRETPVFERKKLLSLYAAAGAVIGLYLPIAYILEGVVEGDKEGIKAATPHVFLLASQVFMEGVASSAGFSLPVRVLIPVFYNSMRIVSIVGWLKSEIWKVDVKLRRLYVGKGLAVANMAFWSFNLFGFLLPFYLPKAFKMYYSKIQ